MNVAKNIDSFIEDATILVITGDYGLNAKISMLNLPEINDNVSLDTDAGYSMQAEVTEISEDKEVFTGKVTHGYYPENDENKIEVGEVVIFSRKKIYGVHKRMIK